jgi:hypothetical protein
MLAILQLCKKISKIELKQLLCKNIFGKEGA